MQISKMMMRFICFVSILLIVLPSQSQDTLYQKRKLTSIDIELFYSYYGQDGNHSAVTGGLGTEKLTVNNIGTNIDVTIDTSHTIIFETFLDVITSASVDNINFVKSSASLHDNHISVHVGYQYTSKKSPFIIGGKYMFGLESDFLSHGFNLWSSLSSKDLSRNFSISLVCFFDDLRWGRFSDKTGHKPTTLVYPYELRYKQWFDIYRRNSYNLQLGYRQDLNKRVSMQIDFGMFYQQGLISTSFHRIFFYDSDSGVVENLPRHRLQFPVGIGVNAFLTNSWILKAYYRFFMDDLGIRSHTLTLESPVKISYQYTLYPFVRFYNQTGSVYFKTFGLHSVTDEFYTSDYDLSTFNSYKVGLGFGFYPDKRMGKSRWSFNSVVIRYAYFWRTDLLDAHIISLLFNIWKG